MNHPTPAQEEITGASQWFAETGEKLAQVFKPLIKGLA